MQRGISKILGVTLTVAVLALAGCSGGGDDGAGEASGDGEVELTYMDADGNCAAGPADGVDFDAAAERIESFQQASTGLLQTEALPEPVSPDTTVAFLNNDTAVAGLMYGFIQQAADAAGVHLVNVSTGTDAQSINAALNSVVEMQPDILISVALDATFFQDQLTELEDAGVAIVYSSQPNAEEFGLDDTLGGKNSSLVNGEVLAAGAVNFTCGTGNDFVFYNTPEMSFSQIQQDAAQSYLAELCPDCTLRLLDISIMDPSPADKIVSDLQTHPETDFFITPIDQFQIGLADKAALAGIENARGFGQSSLPPNIQQIVDGTQTAGFAVDLDMFMWLLLDEGFRKMQDVFTPYDDWDTVNRSVSQVLVPSNAEDYLNGFVAYPDKDADFVAMWTGQ